ARSALVRLAAGLEDVAEDPSDLVGLPGPPGEDAEGGGVGHGDHVRLLDAVEAGDRGAVEAHPVLERVGQLVAADGERLQLAQDVREPEADEFDVLRLDPLEDVGGADRPFFDGCHYVGAPFRVVRARRTLTTSMRRGCPGADGLVPPAVARRGRQLTAAGRPLPCTPVQSGYAIFRPAGGTRAPRAGRTCGLPRPTRAR